MVIVRHPDGSKPSGMQPEHLTLNVITRHGPSGGMTGPPLVEPASVVPVSPLVVAGAAVDDVSPTVDVATLGSLGSPHAASRTPSAARLSTCRP